MEPGLLEWCKRLIAFPSVTANGTRGIAQWCAAQMLAPSGISARLLPSTRHGSENVNLMAIIPGRDAALAPLIFNTHLDTVPPGDPALWTACASEPLRPQIVGDRIYGLGSADTKLDFAAKVTALAGRRPRRTVYLLGTFGEERGLLGAKELAASGMLPPRGLAFVGEPSGLAIVTAHKGLSVFELKIGFSPVRCDAEAVRRMVFKGRSTHSSTPHLGDNAIKKALAAIRLRPEVEILAFNGGDAVNKVPAICEVMVSETESIAADETAADEAAREFAMPREALAALDHFIAGLERFAETSGPAEDDFPAPTLTCNPGVVRSSERAITLEFELRPPPLLSLEAVRSGIAALSDGLARDFPDLVVELRELRASPGYRAPLDSEVVTVGMEAQTRAGILISHSVKSGCTEAGVYAAAGLAPVIFGPGPFEGNIHAPNEFNLLSEVELAVRFYTAVLEL